MPRPTRVKVGEPFTPTNVDLGTIKHTVESVIYLEDDEGIVVTRSSSGSYHNRGYRETVPASIHVWHGEFMAERNSDGSRNFWPSPISHTSVPVRKSSDRVHRRRS